MTMVNQSQLIVVTGTIINAPSHSLRSAASVNLLIFVLDAITFMRWVGLLVGKHKEFTIHFLSA